MSLVFTSKKERRQVLTNLKRGLKTLETKGWCQRHYSLDSLATHGKKRYCAVGSMQETARQGIGYFNVVRPTCEALQVGILRTGRLPRKLVTAEANCIVWNDAKGRTAVQVKRAFRAAIKATERAEVV